MDPADVLKSALAVLRETEVDEHLAPVALAKLMDLYAGQHFVPVVEGGGGGTHDEARDMAEWEGAIAKELEVESSLVERLFDEHEGTLQFVGDLEKLGGSKQAKVERLSVILCSARQAAGLDEGGRTPDSAVRGEIERHGLYDVGNYSKHMKYLRGLANANGSGSNTTYKLKYEGRVAARAIAKQLLSG